MQAYSVLPCETCIDVEAKREKKKHHVQDRSKSMKSYVMDIFERYANESNIEARQIWMPNPELRNSLFSGLGTVN